VTVYTSYGLHSIFVGAQNTVSKIEDHSHILNQSPREEGDERPVALTCSECEPYLLREGWKATPAMQTYRRRPDDGSLEPIGKGVPLTSAQLQRLQDQEDQASAAVRNMGQRLTMAAGALATRGPVRPRTRRARG
jgi:hypothetical protein